MTRQQNLRTYIVVMSLAVLAAIASQTQDLSACTDPPQMSTRGGWQRCSTIPWYSQISSSGLEDAMSAWSAVVSDFGQSVTRTTDPARAAQAGILVYFQNLGGPQPFTQKMIGAGISVDYHPGTIRNRAAVILLNNNSQVMNQGASSFQTYMKKLMLHEMGHALGLADMGLGCAQEGDGDSVMNQVCGINDSLGNMPTSVTSCDASRAKAYGSCPQTPLGRLECAGESDCQWNPDGIGEDTCTNPGWDPESCGGGTSETNETEGDTCEATNLDAEWCDQMCYDGYGGDWDLNCNGWSDWDDCDFYYGECGPPPR